MYALGPLPAPGGGATDDGGTTTTTTDRGTTTVHAGGVVGGEARTASGRQPGGPEGEAVAVTRLHPPWPGRSERVHVHRPGAQAPPARWPLHPRRERDRPCRERGGGGASAVHDRQIGHVAAQGYPDIGGASRSREKRAAAAARAAFPETRSLA